MLFRSLPLLLQHTFPPNKLDLHDRVRSCSFPALSYPAPSRTNALERRDGVREGLLTHSRSTGSSM